MSAKNPIVNHATVHAVPDFISNTRLQQRTETTSRLTPLRLCLFLLLALFVLVGCGPEEGASDADLTAATIRIAQEYQQNGNLGDARAQLDALDAANPTQFLIFLAEERADSDAGSAETNALVQFALALGLQSGQLMAYAMQNGLIAAGATATPPPVAQQPAAQPIASSAPATAIPTPTAVAAVAVEPAQNDASAANESDSPAPSGAEDDQAAESEAEAETDAEAEPESEAEPDEESAATVNLLPTATKQSAAQITEQEPTATAISKPQIQASTSLNVRSGPGTAYPVVGALSSGQPADIVAKNPEGDWWQITLPSGTSGWVYGPLVQATGDTTSIAIATDIPAAPPTPTPAPVAQAPAEQPPAAEAPAEQPAAEQPTAEPPPAEAVPAGNDFISIERRLWTVEETGGVRDSAGSVRCGEKRELHVIVLDANGNRLNGVAVQAIYGAQEIFVTGSQGKGDGQVEFVLGSGQGVKVIRDTDGREVTSDVVDGMSTHSPVIPHEDLISAGFCWDKESCDKFNFSAGCWGHHSWTVTFKRRY